MTIPYIELEHKKIELANLNNSLVKSTIIDLDPKYIMPDGTIYYIVNDMEEINKDIKIYKNLEKLNRISKIPIDKEKLLKQQEQELLIDYERFQKNDIRAKDIRKYLNYNIVYDQIYEPELNNLHSIECQKILLSLLKSKLQVVDYFIKNKLENTNNLDDFILYNMKIDKIEHVIPKTITSTKNDYMRYYFNYIIMGYTIFKLASSNLSIMKQYYDSELDKEIEYIKKLPINERCKYFR